MEDATTFLSQRRRLRRVMKLMLSHAQQACAGEIISPLTLTELAEEACWSKEHFVRIWTKVFHEPPIATARRIRLDLAADSLLGGASVSRAADRAGFSSVEAFSHAFRRQFGMSAREFVQSRQSVRHNAPAKRIVTIGEPISCLGIPYTGPSGPGVDETFDATLNLLVKSGATDKGHLFGLWARPPRKERSPERQIELCSAVIENNLRVPIRGLSRFTIPAGHYVRLNHARLQSLRQIDEWLLDEGWNRKDGPSIQEFITDPVRTIPSKRQEGLLLPIVPIRLRHEFRPQVYA